MINDEIYYGIWREENGILKKDHGVQRHNSDYARSIFLEYVCLSSLRDVLTYFHQPHQFYHSSKNIFSASQKFFPEELSFIEQLVARNAFKFDSVMEQKVEKAVSFMTYLKAKVP